MKQIIVLRGRNECHVRAFHFIQAWLEQSDTLALIDLLQPYAGVLAVCPVSKAVNFSKTDGPELIKNVEIM